MSLTKQHCPECNAEDFKCHTTYTVKSGEQRSIFYCADCGNYFSETKNTPLVGHLPRLCLYTDV
jgi:transposase-like protein